LLRADLAFVLVLQVTLEITELELEAEAVVPGGSGPDGPEVEDDPK
jgi:hypothetical protein